MRQQAALVTRYRRLPRALRHVLLVGLLGLTACGTTSPDAALPTAAQSISSWAATAHAVGVGWTEAQLPNAYARQTLLTAQQALSDETATLGAPAASPPRAALRDHGTRLTQLVGQLAAAVEQGDRSAASGVLPALAGEQQALAAWVQEAGVAP